VRRTSRDWGKDDVLQPLVRGAHGPVLVYPGEQRPLSVNPPVEPYRLPRLAGPLLILASLLLGVWMVHTIFARARQPDCDREPYRCAVRENLMGSTKDRLNQTQPRADPHLGP